MEHSLFHSKFKTSSVGRSSLLDVIRDPPSGENAHRVVAMELIFDRAIDDCQGRMLAQAKKSSQADPVAQLSSREKLIPMLTTATQPTKTQLSPPVKRPKPTTVKPASRKQPDSFKVQLPQPPAQPRSMKVSTQPSTFQTTATSCSPPTPSTNTFGDPSLPPPTFQASRRILESFFAGLEQPQRMPR